MPARKYFYSFTKDGRIGNDGKIWDGHISVKDYMTCEKRGINLKWKIWVIITIISLKKDVFVLADVFEKFIAACLKFYGLDLCHYFSSPGLSWDAMLKMTGVKLEKISGIDKYLFIEKGLRWGISHIAKR